jgi:hypothetical protein
LIRVLALLMGVSLGAVAAEEPPQVYHVEDTTRFGRPKRIVTPDYPADALARHITGYVDMRGHISPLMAFTDIEYSPGTPEAAIFVDALKQVIAHWEFHPVFQHDCFPTDDPVSLRVNFEIDGDKPRIFVTIGSSNTPKGPSMSIVNGPRPEYPRAAVRAGLQAYVYGRLEVAPDGSVTRVISQVYPRRAPLDNLVFEREVEGTFVKWRFNALPEGETRKRVACEQVFFRLVD